MGPNSRPTSRVPQAPWGSSCCPTCAGCSASTRNWPSASRTPATARSRSTTSAAPPAPARGPISLDSCGPPAGLGPRGEDFDYPPHVQQTTPDTVAADVHATVECLKRETGVTTVVTVGFCFGGAQSFMQGARDHGLAGVVGFYGSLVRDGQRWTLDRAPDITVPVLGLFAGDDQNITAEMVAEFGTRLRVPHEIHTYPGAPHSFFDRRQEQYAAESEDAWNRVLTFISERQAEG